MFRMLGKGVENTIFPKNFACSRRPAPEASASGDRLVPLASPYGPRGFLASYYVVTTPQYFLAGSTPAKSIEQPRIKSSIKTRYLILQLDQ